MKHIFSTVTLGLGLAMASSVSVAETTTLNVSTWLPPTHVQNSVVWPTWAEWVKEATDGRVEVNIEYTSSNPTQLFQMVEDGVTDAAFSFHGFVPGRFDLEEIVELPGLGVNSEAASYAHWNTYQKYLKDAGEHDGLELLALFAHGQGVMQTNFEVNDLDDLVGKKIRIGGGVQAEIGKRLEVVPVAAPGNKVYELMQTKVVDGVFMPMTEQKAQRLVEVAPNITILDSGMYMGSFVMFINPEFMESLSPEDAEAIRSVSGEKLSVMAGAAWDKADTEAREYSAEQGANIQVWAVDDERSIAYNKKMEGLDEQWIKKAEAKGIDAKAALEMLRTEAKKYAAEHQQ